MTLDKRINAFVELGNYLRQLESPNEGLKYPYLLKELRQLILHQEHFNKFYTTENVLYALWKIAEQLTAEHLTQWLKPYNDGLQKVSTPKAIGVIMAGNIPLAGFHDFLSVLISGNTFVGKLSSEDKYLLPHLAHVLLEIESAFAPHILFKDRIQDIDAIIATGGNNSGRYFDFYFSKYPHIIRRNRNSVAVISGTETKAEFGLLATDIFQYFGLGCRSVSKLYVPENYNFNAFFEGIEEAKEVVENTKYRNNYDYNKSILLLNKVPHLDNGFLLLREESSMQSAISVLHYEVYHNKADLEKSLNEKAEQLQCVIAKDNFVKNSLPYGAAQSPALGEYADKVDTMDFLLGLEL